MGNSQELVIQSSTHQQVQSSSTSSQHHPLPPQHQQEEEPPNVSVSASSTQDLDADSIATLEQMGFEREHVVAALQHCRGDVALAADVLLALN